jgi:hypothetical protein
MLKFSNKNKINKTNKTYINNYFNIVILDKYCVHISKLLVDENILINLL